MNDSLNTPTTIFESLSSLSKAIPKFAQDIQNICSPVIFFKDVSTSGIEWYRPLKKNLFLYERLENYNILSVEDICELSVKNFTNILELANAYRSKIIEVNNISPVAIVESISPGMIHWFYVPKSLTYLYDIDSLFPNFTTDELNLLNLNDFINTPSTLINNLNDIFFSKLTTLPTK